MFELTTKELLSLSVLAAIITIFGNLVATFLKEFILTRSFENWKEQRTLQAVYRKYKDPIILSAIELMFRLDEICEEPTLFLRSELIEQKPKQIETLTVDDPYYQRYKLISSIYRLCAFLGWLELYRQDITFLDSGISRSNRKLEKCIENIRSELADGQLNKFNMKKDQLIFREEQRAIGEAMISENNHNRFVMGYGNFCMLFEKSSHEEFGWLRIVQNFLLDIQDLEEDFRIVRLRGLKSHLYDLIVLLDSSRIPPGIEDDRPRRHHSDSYYRWA